jgi:outer membrane biosynthesis protein TonB
VERSSGQLPAAGGAPRPQPQPQPAADPIPFEPALYVDPVEPVDPPTPAVPDEPARAETPEPEPFLPALPIPPRLEPAHPVSSSPVFHRGGGAFGGGGFGGGAVPVSADPSMRISAADIAAADQGESRPRHAVDAEAGSSVLSNLGISGRSGGGGRRRARDGSEPEPARAPAEPARPPAEPPQRPVEPPAPPVADTDERPVQPSEPQPETAAPRVGGKRRRSVQLADLLTEAMMAYQSTQDSTETTSATSSAELPGPQVRPVGLDPAVGDEPGFPGPARHRGDTQSGDSRWLGARWDKPGDRS